MNTTRVASTLIVSMVLAMSASCGSSDNGGGAPVATGGVPTGTGGTSASEGGTTAKPTTTSESEGGSTSGTTSTNAVGGSTNAGGGAASTECPAAKPDVDSACTRSSSMGACTYSDTDCICSGQTWHCYTQADCPAAAPPNEEACDLNSMSCSYGEVKCVCSRQSGWNCATPCPETKPAASGEACTREPRSTCRYGEDDQLLGFSGTAVTTCACADGALTCFAATDCPADPPENTAACNMLTISCEYDDRDCSCGTDGAWDCTTECPEAPPAAEASCAREPQRACSYAEGALVSGGSSADADTDCVCIEGKFACYTQADCPATAPESDTDCTQIGMNCSYDDDATSCRCRTSTNQWSCSTRTNPNNGTAGAPNTGAGGSGAGGTVSAGGTSSAAAGTTSS